MTKKNYLLILLILSCGFLEDGATVSLFDKDILLVAQWIWCVIGIMVYRNQANNKLNTPKNRKYVLWFLLIMIISTIAPYYEYNQPIENTLISQRANYSISVLLVFLYVHPSLKDVFYAVRITGFLSVFILVYSIIDPNLFLTQESKDQIAQFGTTDFGIAGLLPGFDLLRVSFYFTAYRLIVSTKTSMKEIFVLFLLIGAIIVVQSRQTLIITIPIFIYTIFKIKKSFNKSAIIFISFLSIVISLPFLTYMYDTLLNESKDQLGNTDYNRWQALYVFLLEWKTDVFNFFFGHGGPSTNSIYTDKLLKLGEQRGAMAQDIGFLGSYFFYGFLFIALNYYFILQGFLNKKMPLYVKFWCFGFILIPVYQNWGMFSNNSAVVFALLIYLVLYNKQYNTTGVYDRNESFKKTIKYKRSLITEFKSI
jgi:hypothetical protein